MWDMQTMRAWIGTLVAAWRDRRTDEGGVSDETLMIGLMVAAASLVAIAVTAVLTGAASNLGSYFTF
jgi:hypothetical protein